MSTLYWKPVADDSWENPLNWFLNAGATAAALNTPWLDGTDTTYLAYDLTYATGVSEDPTMVGSFGTGATGTCDMGVYEGINNEGTINGGTFSGIGFLNYNVINGGTFTGNDFTNGGTINGGTFTGDGFQNNGGDLIYGGTFSGSGFINEGSIYGGTFTGNYFTNYSFIYGGTFTGNDLSNSDSGYIYGGTYAPTIPLSYSDIISGGNCIWGGPDQYNPGFGIDGGIFSPTFPVSGIPVASDILGTGLL